MANKLQKSLTYASMAGSVYPHVRYDIGSIIDIDHILVECLNLMSGIYSPDVTIFMLALATKRGRLKQLRDLVLMAYNADDIRRFIMNDTYISPNRIIDIMGCDKTRFIWEFPFKHRGRFGNFWQRIRYRIRHWRQR